MPGRKMPLFDYARCMACGACVPACPAGCIALDRQGLDRYRNAFPGLAAPGACTGCGLCSRACPIECISLAERDGKTA
jgi:ferredoxin